MRLFTLSVFVTLLLACNSSQKEPVNLICGLASPVVLTSDTTEFFVFDYILHVPEKFSVSFPEQIEVLKTADTNKYLLVRKPGLPFLSEIVFNESNNQRETILVRNYKNEKVRISFNPGPVNYQSVKVRGTLNFWNASLSKMKKNAKGIWEEEFSLPAGEYQYLLVADGKEKRDPANPDSVNNNIGGYNSLLKVGHYKQEELPFIRTVSHRGNVIFMVSDTTLQQVFALWQNQKIPVKISGNSISLIIPKAAKGMGRSNIRVCGYNETGLSNDLLIPLNNGKVIEDPVKLTRHDWPDMILYFMMIDRFYDGDPGNDEPVDDPEILPKANYYGGDIVGIDLKVREGYFDSLGINALWLSPITQNPLTAYGLYPNPRTKFSGYHGYWPISSTKIDFRYGTSDELNQLISDVHSDSMNILLDYVANHVHELHPVYKLHPDWATSLYLPDGTLNTEKWDEHRLTTWFDTFLPTLDLRRPEVVNPMTDSAMVWIKDYGFDGFRHDATKHIDELFWRTLTKKIKELTPCNTSTFQIGETYGSPELIASYIGSGMLNAQFDFNVYDDAVAVFAREGESFERLKSSLNQSLRYYGYHNLMGYITGNQDRPRFISLAGGDLSFSENSKYAGWTRNIGVGDSSGYKKLMMLHAFNMTIPGIPCIYYGDEIGMPGANDPDNRRWMKFTHLTPSEKQVKQVVSTLAHLRRNTMALLYGDLRFLKVNEKELVYIRTYFDDIVVVVFNKSGRDQTIVIDDPLLYGRDIQPVFGSEIFTEGKELYVKVPYLSFEIIIPKLK